MNSFFLSRWLPPNAEGSAEQSEAKGACLRTQVRIFKSCNLCPDSYRSRWSGMASHSLLQRRFAPRKVVRLLPDKRGLLFCMSHFDISCQSHFIIFRVLFYFLGKIFSEAFYFYINTCIIKKDGKGNRFNG